MSVYIKGMEMPTSCLVCSCTDTEYGECVLDPEKRCPEDYGKIADWCPLVPVQPHGDLIDRDALSKSLDRLCDRVCQYSKAQRKAMCGACPLGDAFTVVEDDAPTIIPADKEGEGWV